MAENDRAKGVAIGAKMVARHARVEKAEARVIVAQRIIGISGASIGTRRFGCIVKMKNKRG